jgi:uncharacterized protein (TIGR02145 family)
MPDGRTWFAENLNYTKDLTYNAYAYEANGKMFISSNGAQAIGSYWCPGADGSTYSGDQNMCNIYGALYTWETAMMVDGKYADESKTNSAWDETWVSPYYYTGAPSSSPNADWNNARGGTTVKGGGRGICPMGWHMPTHLEWADMLDSCEGDGSGAEFANTVLGFNGTEIGNDEGKKLKSAYSCSAENIAPGCWYQYATLSGEDTYGYRALPAGTVHHVEYEYQHLGNAAFWIASSALDYRLYPSFVLTHFRDCTWGFRAMRSLAVSIRCLRDL